MKGIKHGKALIRVSIGGNPRKADYVLVWATIMNMVFGYAYICYDIKRVVLFSGFSWGAYPSSKTRHSHWKYAEFQRYR